MQTIYTTKECGSCQEGLIKKSSVKSCGFTFVELLVGITLLVLIFAVGYANYRGFQRRQHLESAVRMVVADLRLAQEKSISGVKPPLAPCTTSPLGGYTFRRANSTSYQIYAVCPDWNDRVSVKGPVSLPDNTNLSVSGGGRFTFESLARGTGEASDIVITLSHSGGGVASHRIIVTPEGEIHVQ